MGSLSASLHIKPTCFNGVFIHTNGIVTLYLLLIHINGVVFYIISIQMGYIYCNTLQHVATRCHTLPHTATHCNTLQHTSTHCNTLQHTATHCNTPQHTATHSNTPQHTATHCKTLQHTATHCNTLQHTATHCNTPHHNTLQHTATHCITFNALQYSRFLHHTHTNGVVSTPHNMNIVLHTMTYEHHLFQRLPERHPPSLHLPPQPYILPPIPSHVTATIVPLYTSTCTPPLSARCLFYTCALQASCANFANVRVRACERER